VLLGRAAGVRLGTRIVLLYEDRGTAMALYVKEACHEQNLKWAWIWFKQLAAFHQTQGKGAPVNAKWEFSAEQVIQLLRSKRDANVPVWKRMKVIEGLITFRIEVQGRSAEDLIPSRTLWV
jgi:hypothetical protein